VASDPLPAAAAETLFRLISPRGKPALDSLDGPGWDAAVRCLSENRMAGWAYHRLKLLEPAAVPEPAMRALYRAFRANQLVNLVLLEEAKRVLPTLAARGLSPVPMKGIAFLERLYPDLGGRKMGDLDLLVNPREVPQAVAVLEALGYRAPPPPYPEEGGVDLELIEGTVVCRIDLNWQFVRRVKGNVRRRVPAAVWEAGRVTRRIAGADVMVLAPEDELLGLANHIVMHDEMARLPNIVDAALLLDAQPVDWARLNAQAALYGLERPLAVTLGLLADVLGMEVPGDARERWRSHRAALLRTPAGVFLDRGWVLEHRGVGGLTEAPRAGFLRNLARFWLRYTMMATLGDRVSFVLAQCAPTAPSVRRIFRVRRPWAVRAIQRLLGPPYLVAIAGMMLGVRLLGSVIRSRLDSLMGERTIGRGAAA